MKRVAAFLSYYLGLTFALAAMFSVARETTNAFHFLILPVFGLPIWWIGAGVGVRLGVYPSEFFQRLATTAGLVEPELRDEEVSP